MCWHERRRPIRRASELWDFCNARQIFFSSHIADLFSCFALTKDRVKRREFITLLGGAAAWPFAVRAQQHAKIPRIGIIDDSPRWNAFRHELRDLGYLEGQNVAFDYAYGEGVPERLTEAAAQLVRLPVDVIATYGTAAAFAAKQATTSIPIVMISVGDPVRAGLVTNLAHPGGNVTGNTILGPDIGAKRLQLLQELIPTIRRVAFL
jgi:putative tryptophan/tyrosine transport system substrate-binding protein